MDSTENFFLKSYGYNFQEGNDNFNGHILPKAFGKIQQKVKDLEVREEDVWVCTHPKSGKKNSYLVIFDLFWSKRNKKKLKRITLTPYYRVWSRCKLIKKKSGMKIYFKIEQKCQFP